MRLIDADIVLSPKMWDGNIPNDAPKEVEEFIKGLYERIKNLPTVEAEPIRHGHWIEEETKKLGIVWWCSLCRVGEDKEHAEYYSYCPNCGAKMTDKDWRVCSVRKKEKK